MQRAHQVSVKINALWVRFRYGILLLVIFSSVLLCMRWALPVVIKPWLGQFFSINDVQVDGKIQFASGVRLQSVIGGHVADRALYQVDVDQLMRDLSEVPWVEKVVVQRIWPHELQIKIEETVPIALWNDSQILSHRGDVLTPESVEAHGHLPRLKGQEHQVDLITDMYRQASKILRQMHLRLEGIEFEKGLVWRLSVNDAADENKTFDIILDSEDSLSRLHRFIDHYPSLFHMEERPKSIDLRYPTGMAVSWYPGEGG